MTTKPSLESYSTVFSRRARSERSCCSGSIRLFAVSYMFFLVNGSLKTAQSNYFFIYFSSVSFYSRVWTECKLFFSLIWFSELRCGFQHDSRTTRCLFLWCCPLSKWNTCIILFVSTLTHFPTGYTLIRHNEWFTQEHHVHTWLCLP